MKIHWVNGQSSEDNRIFDTKNEVYEWSNSLYGDFLGYLVSKGNVGYTTPDEKVIKSLDKLIPKWANYLNIMVVVQKDKINVNDKYLYRIWTLNI